MLRTCEMVWYLERDESEVSSEPPRPGADLGAPLPAPLVRERERACQRHPDVHGFPGSGPPHQHPAETFSPVRIRSHWRNDRALGPTALARRGDRGDCGLLPDPA